MTVEEHSLVNYLMSRMKLKLAENYVKSVLLHKWKWDKNYGKRGSVLIHLNKTESFIIETLI